MGEVNACLSEFKKGKVSVDQLLNSRRESPLMVACQKGYEEIALSIIGYGGDMLFLREGQTHTPFIHACHCGHSELVGRLITDYNEKNKESNPLFSYTRLKSAIASSFTSSNSNHPLLDSANDSGETPLIIAAIANKPQVLEVLVNAGAKISQRDNAKGTALFYACQKKSKNSVEVLLRKATLDDLELKYDGETLLQHSFDSEILELLKKRHTVLANKFSRLLGR